MKRRWILAVASLILLIPQILFAQDTPTSIEFYGTIQSANTTAIVINGQIVDIQSAQINTPLAIGTIVRVQATNTNGTFTAIEIDPVTPGLIPGIVEIDGVVSGFYNCGIVIGDFSIDVCDAETRDPILNGQPYRIFAFATTPGRWQALLIAEANILPPAATPEVIPPVATAEVVTPPVSTPEVIAPIATLDVVSPVSTPEVNAPASTPEVGEDFKVTGTLQSFTDADLVVNGQRFFIGGARIEGTLTVGVQVQLEIRVINGQWVLTEIKVVDGSDNSSDDHGGGNSGSGSSGDDGTGDSSGGSNSGGGKGGDDGAGGRGGSNSGSNNSGSDHSGKGG